MLKLCLLVLLVIGTMVTNFAPSAEANLGFQTDPQEIVMTYEQFMELRPESKMKYINVLRKFLVATEKRNRHVTGNETEKSFLNALSNFLFPDAWALTVANKSCNIAGWIIDTGCSYAAVLADLKTNGVKDPCPGKYACNPGFFPPASGGGFVCVTKAINASELCDKDKATMSVKDYIEKVYKPLSNDKDQKEAWNAQIRDRLNKYCAGKSPTANGGECKVLTDRLLAIQKYDQEQVAIAANTEAKKKNHTPDVTICGGLGGNNYRLEEVGRDLTSVNAQLPPTQYRVVKDYVAGDTTCGKPIETGYSTDAKPKCQVGAYQDVKAIGPGGAITHYELNYVDPQNPSTKVVKLINLSSKEAGKDQTCLISDEPAKQPDVPKNPCKTGAARCAWQNDLSVCTAEQQKLKPYKFETDKKGVVKLKKEDGTQLKESGNEGLVLKNYVEAIKKDKKPSGGLSSGPIPYLPPGTSAAVDAAYKDYEKFCPKGGKLVRLSDTAAQLFPGVESTITYVCGTSKKEKNGGLALKSFGGPYVRFNLDGAGNVLFAEAGRMDTDGHSISASIFRPGDTAPYIHIDQKSVHENILGDRGRTYSATVNNCPVPPVRSLYPGEKPFNAVVENTDSKGAKSYVLCDALSENGPFDKWDGLGDVKPVLDGPNLAGFKADVTDPGPQCAPKCGVDIGPPALRPGSTAICNIAFTTTAGQKVPVKILPFDFPVSGSGQAVPGSKGEGVVAPATH